jgi:hypothetical protein
LGLFAPNFTAKKKASSKKKLSEILKYNKAAFGEISEKQLDGVAMHSAFWQHINFIGKYNI